MREPKTPKAAKRRSRANLIHEIERKLSGQSMGLRCTTAQIRSTAKRIAITAIARARKEAA